MAGVLSQKQNDIERVVAYYSRTLNKPERNYCVTRKELLAVVSSVKHFHHYLFGKNFLIRTDHGALKWLMRFKNPEGQVARWLEILNTYDFQIEHRQGRYHGNSDGLSRRPCEDDACEQCRRIERYMSDSLIHIPVRLPKNPVEPESVSTEQEQLPGIVQSVYVVKNGNSEWSSNWVDPLSPQQWRDAQRNDPIIGKVIKFKESRAEKPTWEEISPESTKVKSYLAYWDMLYLDNGVLYRTWIRKDGGHRRLLVLPEEFRNGALRRLHDDRVAGHLGQQKTLQRIRERYYWVGFTEDVHKWCTNCQVCIQKDKPRMADRAPMKVYNVGAPMERIALDILGPFIPESKAGNKYVLCIGDYFTKWISATAIPNQEAETVARTLVENVITIFGVPRIIHTDQDGRRYQVSVTEVDDTHGHQQEPAEKKEEE